MKRTRYKHGATKSAKHTTPWQQRPCMEGVAVRRAVAPAELTPEQDAMMRDAVLDARPARPGVIEDALRKAADVAAREGALPDHIWLPFGEIHRSEAGELIFTGDVEAFENFRAALRSPQQGK